MSIQARSGLAAPGTVRQDPKTRVFAKRLVVATLSLAAALVHAKTGVRAQTVLTGNHSVAGNLCVGADCGAPESFGNYPLKLNGPILGIAFEDTSSGTSEPTTDWFLEANDAHLFGQDSFSLKDGNSGFRVFKIEAYAPAASIHVDNLGQVGFGTAAPAAHLHVVTDDTPTLRFEQNAINYDPHIWELFGNEASFRLRDDTNNTVPFRVEPGTGNDAAMTIEGNGEIGLGTINPTAALHLRRSDGTALFLVEESSATTSPRTLLNLQNNGRPEIVMGNTDTNGEWSFGAGSNFILKQGTVGSAASAKTKLFEIDPSGNATLAGALTTGGPSCAAGCDAVFSPGYDLPSVAEHAAAMFALGHLPNVGPTGPDRPVNLTDHMGRILNELEHAHIYIARQEDRIAALQDGEARARARIARLEALVTALLAAPE